MEILQKDILFHFCSKDDKVPDSHISYYGWEFGVKHKFESYIKGYREAAKCTFNCFLQSSVDDKTDIQDTICYPLIFIHRHCFELSLKFLYINLFENYDPVKVKELINKSHDLLNIWLFIKNDLKDVASRIGFIIYYDAIECYVEQFDKEDKKSFDYRYPIRKDDKLSEVHTKWKYLDIVNFHEKMTAILDYLYKISHYVDNQLTEFEFNEEFNANFDNVLLSSKDKILELFSYYDVIGNIEKQNKDKKWLKMSDIQMSSEDELEKRYTFINSFSLNQKILLIILSLAGSKIGSFNLAINEDERRKDIYRLLFDNYCFDRKFVIEDYFDNGWFEDFDNKVIAKSRSNKQRILRILSELHIEL